MDIPEILDELASQVEDGEFIRPKITQVTQSSPAKVSFFAKLRGKEPPAAPPFLLDFWRITRQNESGKVYGLITTYSNGIARFDAAWWVLDTDGKKPIHHGSISDMTLTYTDEKEREQLCQKTLAAALRELEMHAPTGEENSPR